MDPKSFLAQENRTGRILGAVGVLGLLVFLSAGFIPIGDAFRNADNSAETLAAVADVDSGKFFLSNLMQAIGLLLFAGPIVFMFLAANAREPRMRRVLVGLALAGPLFYAVSLMLRYTALDSASSQFLAPGSGFDPTSVDDADGVLQDQSTWNLSLGMQLAGVIAFAVSLVYTGLYAMRTGLMTRFWGTLVMALGASTVVIGPVPLFPVIIVFSLFALRAWPGGLPPAWEAGEAIPWTRPGEEPRRPVPAEGEEPARPEDFEGSAAELDPTRPGRRDNKRKRKRKQRG